MQKRVYLVRDLGSAHVVTRPRGSANKAGREPRGAYMACRLSMLIGLSGLRPRA